MWHGEPSLMRRDAMRNLRAQEPPRDVAGELLEWVATVIIAGVVFGLVWLAWRLTQ
jgi:hypothetical protein